ncbi:MAG: hypothetical protein KDN18_25400 [Verrucomicrobiae bacterium]|nr:hypothetical protein [Verrucomicrobiae bacterium]
MQPPICDFCHRDGRDHPTLEFALVTFRDYRPIDRPGHPDGMLWFCEDHVAAARTLKHLDSGPALRRMRETEATGTD